MTFSVKQVVLLFSGAGGLFAKNKHFVGKRSVFRNYLLNLHHENLRQDMANIQNQNSSTITGDVKSRIDKIWDTLWAGGITVPVTILEQLTYLFFIKLLDDKQRHEESNAIEFGYELENPLFKKGEKWLNPETNQEVAYEDLRWSVFKGFSAQNMLHHVRNNVFVFIKGIGKESGSAYSRYMQDAVFSIPKADVLQSVIDDIDLLDMEDADTMGDVYEYMLARMSEKGQNGQFRTPRHIIRMIITMAEPKIDDVICDPAMGSAGFIMEAARQIYDQNRATIQTNEDVRKRYYSTMFNGFDTDQTMLRIGAMNMLLHGIPTPNIKYQDSLSEDNTDASRYTLCVANPPFSGKVLKSTISKSLLSIANTNATELLFLALFVRSLKVGGRCFSVVPDGVLFGNDNAHMAIRKELIDKQCLRAVISMPAGVFQPYSGVSTAILIFTKTDAGGTDNVWFYEMHADGFTLNAKRTPTTEDDIPDLLQRWQNLEAERARTRRDQSFFVPVDEIRKNDYDLTFNKYKEVVREKVEYDDPKDVFARIEALEAQFAAKQQEFKEKYL